MTLIELECAMVAAAVLALCVGVVAETGTRLSRQANAECALKRDASIACRFVQHQVRSRASEDIEIAEDGAKLVLDADAVSPPYFRKDESDLVYFDGVANRVIVDNEVQSLEFELLDGHTSGEYLVHMTIQLSRSGFSNEMETSVTLRN